MATDILSLVKNTIIDKVEVEENDIQLESRLVEDLGFDSLGLVELVLTFEEAFNVQISESETEKFRTVKDVVQYIEGLGHVGPSAASHPR
jgi:acyl carrier protein